MAKIAVHTQRFDPYKNFKFRLKWEGRYVAGVSKVTGLKGVVEHRPGGDPGRKSPGRTEFEAIILERGVTHEPLFAAWASKTCQRAANPFADFRKDIFIDVFNRANRLTIRYKAYRCWVSEYQASPDLDAKAKKTKPVAIKHIKLENEGWERDPSGSEPVEV